MRSVNDFRSGLATRSCVPEFLKSEILAPEFLLLGFLLFASLSASAQATTYEVENILNSGPVENRINLVILGDGYTAQQQSKLSADTEMLVDSLFSHPPFAEYQGLFNIKLVKVISQQDGARNGSYGDDRNTALGAYFNCMNIDRLLCVNDQKVLSLAAKHSPEYDHIVVVVNDPKYGGAGGRIATTSIATNALDILPHELGHTMSQLADEYEDPYPGYPGCGLRDCPEPNVSRSVDREQIKWAHHIHWTTPLPTPKNGQHSGVGAFEGARYQALNHYRPTENACLMRTLGKHFCPVCAEAMARAFWNRVDLVDERSPLQTSLSIEQCEDLNLAVTSPVLDAPLLFEWSLNLAPLAHDELQITFPAGSLELGLHTISLHLMDENPFFPPDPELFPSQIETWKVRVFACGKKSEGSSCLNHEQCDSGVCSDGICCDSLCDGICESCKQPGTEGQCRSVTGIANPPGACGGELCEAGSCKEGCQNQAECATGFFCGSSGQCLPALPSGEECSEDFQCLTGSCAQGVCCDRPCKGACKSCRTEAHFGRCVELSGEPATAGACQGLLCSHGQCLGTCSDGSHCESGRCVEGSCHRVLDLGEECSADAYCGSGFCREGLCCNRTCDGGCESCSQPDALGRCQKLDPEEAPYCQPAPAPADGCGCNSGSEWGLGSLVAAMLWFGRRRKFEQSESAL